MKKTDVLVPRFSLLSMAGCLLVWSCLLPVVLFYPFTKFSLTFAGGQGFPLTYYTWADCGPPFSHFLWWNLILDILFLSTIVVGGAFLIEGYLVARLRGATEAATPNSGEAISGSCLPGLAACVLAASGIILPIFTYDAGCFAPAATVWACAESFAIILGVLAWRNALGKTAVVSALILTVLPVMLYLAYPKVFGAICPESPRQEQARYGRTINAQPEPLRSFLKATRPGYSDPDMVAYRNAVLTARKSFSPVLTGQLVALVGDDSSLGNTAKELLEAMYAGDFLVDGTWSWRIPQGQVVQAMETLIAAMGEAKTKMGLVTCLWIFVKATGIEMAEIHVDSMKETVKIEATDCSLTCYFFSPRDDAWKGKMTEIVPLFQKYCRDRLASMRINAGQGTPPLPLAPQVKPSDDAR